uniref:G-protein coupled receptors family 1 profile domain-containing protein n=1 Tax=Ditylenchus dipsaci TaxID=166011 RepID=A0A915DDY9_9BILA
MKTWSQCTTVWHKLRALQYLEEQEFTENFDGERVYTSVHLMTVFWVPFLILFLAYFTLLFTFLEKPRANSLLDPTASDGSGENVSLWQNGASSTPTLPIRNGSIKSGGMLGVVPAWRVEMRSRMFRTTVNVIAAYLICWMPYNVLSLATFFSGDLQIMISTHLGTLRVCVLLNTLLNPFLYGFSS